MFKSIEKDLTAYPFYIERFKHLDVLDLWFNPVYEEEYKPGDMVICKDDEGLYIGEFIGIQGNHYTIRQWLLLGSSPLSDRGNQASFKSIVRKATAKEIKDHQVIEVELCSNQGLFYLYVCKGYIYYAVENVYLDVKTLQEWLGLIIDKRKENIRYEHLNGSKNLYLFEVKTIDSECKKNVPIEDWIKVFEAYNSLNE